MAETEVLPELKQIIGAMIFAADRSLSVKEMRGCLKDVAESRGGETKAFARVSEDDILKAIQELIHELAQRKLGFFLSELAGGFRFQSDAGCGKWLRQLLDAGASRRLSWPALETLAIIAYRQPITRAEVEAVRGVNVDHMVKTLLEMQLVKIAGRSELPGKPFTYGTTQVFLEYFGLKNLDELSQMNPMLLRPDEKDSPRVKKAAWTVEKIVHPTADGGTAIQPALPLDTDGAAESDGDGRPAQASSPVAEPTMEPDAQEDAVEDAEEDTEEDTENKAVDSAANDLPGVSEVDDDDDEFEDDDDDDDEFEDDDDEEDEEEDDGDDAASGARGR